jgi:diguanylate cyclase (GGDEF)-like protein
MAIAKARKIRVLVIDDSSTVRIAASRIFGAEFDVILAVDGEDGLDVIKSDPNIQVIFTDLVMPEMDGFELLKALRAEKDERINSLPIIVMTGAENPDIAKQKAISLGATDFITKPFNATDIRARARSYAQLSSETKNLKERVTIDSLTGLLNQRGFYNQLEKEIAFISRHQYSFCMMTIEIDRYKKLFVNMGRNSAEKIIQHIAKMLKLAMRKEDTIARTGLARFSVSMPLIDNHNALEIANKICGIVESFKAKLNGKRLPLTVSAGIISIDPENEVNPDQLFEMADDALQKATSLGESQLHLLTMDEFYSKPLNGSHTHNGSGLSIDSLIEKVNSGEDLIVADQLDAALEQLAPLLSLLSNEQKQRVISLGIGDSH